ncbi:MAG TPA: universal stress protein [Actinomycetota bacterium]|nr:universal stress protein [Actinomycetota bacterium]
MSSGGPRAPLSRSLAGTDGSERAQEAVRQSARLAALTGASLDVVFVIDARHPHEDRDVEAVAEEVLGRAEEVARREQVEPTTRVLAGDPAEVLVAEAAQIGAELICLGPDAGAFGGTIRVGRVAAHVIRHAGCSVMLARGSPQGFPRRIQCGVDGSDSSVETARLAAGIAAVAGAELHLQHVIPIFRGDNQEWSLDRDEPTPPELIPAVDAARSWGVEPVRDMAMGRPENALVETARRDQADLTVVGSRGLSGMARVLLGSVCEYVAQHAPCSVLIARPGPTG